MFRFWRFWGLVFGESLERKKRWYNLNMSSLLNNSKLKEMRRVFLWIAVCILIGEVIIGAVLILTQSWNDIIGKLMGTMALAAIALFVGINNFIRIEKGDAIVRGLAWTSFVMNIIWLVMAVLMVWEVPPFIWQEEVRHISGGIDYYTREITAMGRVMMVAISVAVAGFWTSNVLEIKETVKPVKPLKVTAVVCELYCCIYYIFYAIFGLDQTGLNSDWGRWSALSGLAGLAFVVTALAALIVSKVNRKKEKVAALSPQDSPEIQATIRDMVEKEVQARLEQERVKSEQAATPPLQADDMPPTVSHDGEVKIMERPEVQNEIPQSESDESAVPDRET